MINIAFVYDNKEFLELINKLIHSYIVSKKIYCKVEFYQNPELLYLDFTEKKKFDICFLDIEMPQMNGIELAYKIRENDKLVRVVFLTSHKEFIRVGYKVKAFDFISKEDIREELPDVMDRLLLNLEEYRESIYVIQTNSRIEKISYDDIIYIYKEGQNAKFVLKDGETQERISLRKVAEKLSDDEFVFVERGYIINLSHIKKISSREIELSNGEKKLASRERIHEIRERMNIYYLHEFGTDKRGMRI